ncbi:MAG: hypothetical protein IKW49_02885 [Opitutales bacterium]|nr:hypothetical protein [Opitutales bacterium]
MSVKKSSQKTAPARPASKTTAKAPASKKTVAKKPSAPEKKAPVAAVKKPAKKIVEAVKEVAEKETAKRSLIAPAKRGRKAKTPPAPVSANAGISVPRDVKAMNASFSHRNRARAYNPFELEQLLFQRGVTNINIFNPNADIVPVKKAETKKIILTTLPKSKEKRTIGAVSLDDLFGFNPFAEDAVSQEEKLIPEKWLKYYRKLMARKSELQTNISRHSESAFRKEGKEETGDVSAYSQHTADIDNEAFDRDFAISRLGAEQEELAEISIAVERMKKGTYGICEITGKPIPAERLNKVPFTRYSLEGKIEAEKQRRAEARRRQANATGDISEVIDIENDSPISLPEEHEEP